MLKQLTLRNFKCFAKASLRLAPLTLLTGVNGTGKSSVIQSLLLLRQSYDHGLMRGNGLLLDGELLRSGRGVDVLYENADEDFVEIGFTIPKDIVANWRFSYNRGEDVMRLESGPNWSQISAANIFGSDFCYLQAERIGPRSSFDTSEHLVHLRRQLGSDGRFASDYLMKFGSESMEDSVELWHPATTKGASTTLREQVELWMREIAPGIRISCVAQESTDTVSLKYAFSRAAEVSRAYRATNVGFGITFVLPIVVALLSSKLDGLILIENPEAHLHPRGQSKIAELICRAASSGSQVIVESHSDHVLNAVRLAVRNKLLKSSDVAIHYFAHGGPDSAHTSVETLALDEDGRLKQWPQGFFDESDRALEALILPRENET